MEKRQKVTTEQRVKAQREAPEPSCISSNISTTTLGLAYKTTVTSKLKEKKNHKTEVHIGDQLLSVLQWWLDIRLFVAFASLKSWASIPYIFIQYFDNLSEMVHKSKVIYIYLNKTSNWWFINSVVTKFLHKHGKEYEDHLGSTAFKIRKLALKKKKWKQRQETKGTNGEKKNKFSKFCWYNFRWRS